MGGPGSGVWRKPAKLSKRRRPGMVARVHGKSPEKRAVLAGMDAIAADNPDRSAFLFGRVAERVMVLDVLASRHEAEVARGNPINVPEYLALVSAWSRLTQAIGLDRRARPVASLHEYMAAKAQSSAPGANLSPPDAAHSSRESPPRPGLEGTTNSTPPPANGSSTDTSRRGPSTHADEAPRRPEAGSEDCA